jgi:hypothetical protein
MEDIITCGLRYKLRERHKIAEMCVSILGEIMCDCAQIVVQYVFGDFVDGQLFDENLADVFMTRSHSATVDIGCERVRINFHVENVITSFEMSISLVTRDSEKYYVGRFQAPLETVWNALIGSQHDRECLIQSIGSIIDGEPGTCNDMDESLMYARKLFDALRAAIISAADHTINQVER